MRPVFAMVVPRHDSVCDFHGSFMPLFADDVVLPASPGCDPQQAHGWFAVKCEVIRMRVSTSMSEAMVLRWKMLNRFVE